MKKKHKYNVAVVGVGAVGEEMLKVLVERKFPVEELRVLARSCRQIEVAGQTYQVKETNPDSFKGIDIALFAGTEGEKGAAVTFASAVVKQGGVVIDNGADFRMEKNVPLVVPEVNPQAVKKHQGIIANPNCSTIQLVVALAPIHKKYGLKRVIVTTFQAASGAGRGAVRQLNEEISQIAAGGFNSINAKYAEPAMAQQLGYNIIPHIGGFVDDDYTSEEWKLVKESHKILNDSKIKISATTVRVGVRTGHSEAVYLETKTPANPAAIRKLLAKAPGVILVDDPKNNFYPMPKDVEGKDEVFVGRVRRDPCVKTGLWLWIVADNLRKGAATNAVQIAEKLIAR